jgi:hypothetical protein
MQMVNIGIETFSLNLRKEAVGRETAKKSVAGLVQTT